MYLPFSLHFYTISLFLRRHHKASSCSLHPPQLPCVLCTCPQNGRSNWTWLFSQRKKYGNAVLTPGFTWRVSCSCSLAAWQDTCTRWELPDKIFLNICCIFFALKVARSISQKMRREGEKNTSCIKLVSRIFLERKVFYKIQEQTFHGQRQVIIITI